MQRQTQLANDIWPLILPRIQAMITAAGSGSGGGSGAVNLAAHDLGGSLHKGTLRSDQAPQFLMLDGTRPLAGSLAVDAGVMIDGVDISAHAADPDAHHAKLHAITDAANHSATGSQYQIVGLTAVNTLGLLTPSATPAANAIVKTDSSSAVTFVDVTVTSDLFVTGYLDFGTDVMYEDASYLQVTGSKAVKFNQNIGNAAWTIYNAGGAQFGGNVDIISGGDLTVAGSGSYAGNTVLFADSSGGNVGIMRTPDSQFALDIAGPARATYWIGPHAIQLTGVLLLAHFDGRAPYETNFSGEVNGHMGQVATVSGGLIFRPGKFYKAAQFAPYVENLVTNPSFETGLTGWSAYGGASVAQSAVQALYGQYSMLAVTSGASQGIQGTTSGLTASATYVLSCWVYLEIARSVSLHATDNIDKDHGTTTVAVPAGVWNRIPRQFTTDSHTTVVYQVTANGATSMFVDAVQIENRFYATPYCDGSLGGYSASGAWAASGNGHSWTGTAHASISVRSEGRLSYLQAGNLNPAIGTVMAWVKFEDVTQYRYLMTSTPNGGVAIACAPTTLEVSRANVQAVLSSPVTWQTNTWYHVAVTWSGRVVRTYVNGLFLGTATAGGDFASVTSYLVGRAGDDLYSLNGLMDDFCILDRALPDDEIRAVYESNAPVFAESSIFVFRPTPKGLVWADDEGLWMRDSSGNSVLGIYGGEAATKSWAGFTMAAGDIVFGRNAVGSSAIWWDQSAGKFGFYGAGSGTPQVEIATDGKLVAGAGAVKLDSSGFHAFNASAVATIDIDANGIYLGDGGGRTTVAGWTSGNRIRAYNVGELYEATPETYLDDSSISRTLYPLVIRGIRQGNDATLVEISAVNTSNVGARIIVGEGFRLKDYYGIPYNTNRVVHAIATDIILEATNLQLRSLTTSAAAVGAYSGKIRIQINGTNYYIPYYAS